MDHERAARALAPLVAAFPGWTADTIRVYAHELQRLDDSTSLDAAVRQLLRSADYRPSIAAIVETYRAIVRRQQPAELGDTSAACDPVRGIQIAREAYAAECRRQGREPTPDYFDRLTRTALGAAIRRHGE